MTDVIVVGAGLFGSIIAAALRAQGREVLVIDDQRPMRGSAPAACLMKPSWLSSMSNPEIDRSLKLLDELYGVHDLHFDLRPTRMLAKVHWVDPRKVLVPADIPAKVISIEWEADGRWTARTAGGIDYTAPVLVLACGAWANELLPASHRIPDLVGQVGAAFTWPTQIARPFIAPWAPYKQLVAFNRASDEMWVGDGSAIIQSNWTEQRQQESEHRCTNAVDMTEKPTRLVGIRPYVKSSKNGYLRHLRPGLVVATGGAKNGTMYAALCADKIAKGEVR